MKRTLLLHKSTALLALSTLSLIALSGCGGGKENTNTNNGITGQATPAPIQATPAPILTRQQKIVFISNRDGNSEIYSMNADGTNQTRLTNSPAEDKSPNLSPDGSKVLFIRERNDGSYWSDYITMNADGTDQKILTNLVPSSRWISTQLGWSPDGSKLAYCAYLGSVRKIFVINADGSNRKEIGDLSPDKALFTPIWSPDGTKIAFYTYFDGIYIFNTDGINPEGVKNIYMNSERITALTPTKKEVFSWSGNQRRLLGWAWIDNNKIIFSKGGNLFSINSDMTDLKLYNDVYLGDWSSTVVISPDHKKILFDRVDNVDGEPREWKKYIMNIDGTNMQRFPDGVIENAVTNFLGFGQEAYFSSDSNTLIFRSNRDGNSEIYRMNVDGTEQKNLTNNSGSDLPYSPLEISHIDIGYGEITN
jgi:Tol biopolymer transport system component